MPPIVENRSCKSGVRASFDEALTQVVERSHASGRDHRNRDPRRDLAEELDVIASVSPVAVHARQEDLTSTELRRARGPLDGVEPRRPSPAVGVHAVGAAALPTRVNGHHEHLSSPGRGNLCDQLRARDRRAIDAHFVRTCVEQGVDVFDRTNAPAHRQGHKYLARGPLHDVEQSAARLVGGGDVQERDLVGAGRVVTPGTLDRVASVANIDEIYAFDDASIADVEARNEAFGQHPLIFAEPRPMRKSRSGGRAGSPGGCVQPPHGGLDKWGPNGLGKGMPFCGACGAQNTAESTHCAACHAPLEGEAAPFGSTLTAPTRRSRDEELAHRAAHPSRAPSTLPAVTPPEPSPGQARPGAHTIHVETLDLTSTPLPPPLTEAPPRAAGRAALSKTMVGIAPDLSSATQPVQEERKGGATETERATGAIASLAQTTLGFAPANVQIRADESRPVTQRLGATMIGLPARSDLPNAEPHAGDRPLGGTLLGVARPGIAPTADVLPPEARSFSTTPGIAGSPFHTAESAPPPEASSPPPTSLEPAARLVTASPKTRSKAMWFALGVIGAAAIGAGLAWMTRPSFPIRVSRFETTAEGGDFLVLECKECPPHSTVRIGAAIEPLTNGQARLSAGKRLAVGHNEVEVLLATRGRDAERLSLAVPVAFRVDTSLEELMSDTPRARIEVSAPPGAKVKIQDQPAPLMNGVATLDVPLGAMASGFADTAEPAPRIVPIEVERDGHTKTTEAHVSAWVVPLRMTSPADGHVLGGGPLLVSGRTVKNAKVTVGDRSVDANFEGEFSLILEKPKLGPLEIIARHPQSVGRRATMQLLAAETRSPSPLALADWKPGALVRAEGVVVEVRSDGGSRLVIDVEGGCTAPPCLASISYGEPVQLSQGARAAIIGTVVAQKPPRLLASSWKELEAGASSARKAKN